MARPAAQPADRGPEPDPQPDPASDGDGAPTAADDVKRRFREALERKNAKHHASAAGESGESKVGSTHGPQSHQKNFRRKSGG
jgi:Family of unknown function (DUF5302)